MSTFDNLYIPKYTNLGYKTNMDNIVVMVRMLASIDNKYLSPSALYRLKMACALLIERVL